MRDLNGCSMPALRHFAFSSVSRRCMSQAMRRQACASARVAFGFGIAEEDQHGVADELVDGAAVRQRDRRHLGEIFVEQLRDLLRLQPLGGRREILDVREEDRELLALGVDGDVLLAAENALVDLRRDVARDLHRQRREEIVRRFRARCSCPDRAAWRRCIGRNESRRPPRQRNRPADT